MVYYFLYYFLWRTVEGVPLNIIGCFSMATIVPRKRSDGTTAYRAQIIIKKNKKIIHRESKTFDRKVDAKSWAKKREVFLDSDVDGLDAKRKINQSVTVSKLIEDYQDKISKIKSWGRSKEAVLNAWRLRPEAQDAVADVDSAWLIAFCVDRVKKGAKPATVNQDVIFLRSVFSVAKDLLGVPVGVLAFDEARPTLKKLGLVSKAGERDRRPTIQEISDIVNLAYNDRKKREMINKSGIPIDKLIVFSMFSARRISETCRIEWRDLNRDKMRILVRDMKDPKNKKGNNVWVLLTKEAYSVINSMPEPEEGGLIFPYNSKSVTTLFQRYREKAGYAFIDKDENLKFHDLRHEGISWLAEKNGLSEENWDIPRLQLVSGHKDWNVLQRYVNLLTAEPTDRWANWEWKEKVLC